MSLKGRLEEDMKAALRSGDKVRLGALRLALAAIKQREVDSRQTLDDTAVQSVLERMIKQTPPSRTQTLKKIKRDRTTRLRIMVQIILD